MTSPWDVEVRLTDPRARRPAGRRAARIVARVAAAADSTRPDAEVNALPAAAGRQQRISPVLAAVVAAALLGADDTDGAVDPTAAAALRRVRNRTGNRLSVLPVCGGTPSAARPAAGWRIVKLDGTRITVPAGVSLDLRAVAGACAAQWAAATVAAELGTGVLVRVGGDVATAGGRPGGWQFYVPGVGPVSLPAGGALSTSRSSRAAHGEVSHVDPRTGGTAPVVWVSATVFAGSCVEAAYRSTETMVTGAHGPAILATAGLAAVLMDTDGTVLLLGADHAAALPATA